MAVGALSEPRDVARSGGQVVGHPQHSGDLKGL